MLHLGAIAAALATCAVCFPVLHAAEIRTDGWLRDLAVFEGKIEVGDYDKVRDFAFAHFPLKIYLASPGGDLGEAIKIGRLVRALKLATAVPQNFSNLEMRGAVASSHGLKDAKGNYLCASACFFIFVAGVHRESDIGGDGILGIHRPYMSGADLSVMGADKAMSAAAKTKSLVASYLHEMGVPTKYLDAMFAISKDDIRWIDRDDFAADFSGFIPELADWVNVRCDHQSDVDKKVWEALKNKVQGQMTVAEKTMTYAIMEKLLEQTQCEINVHAELVGAAYKEANDYRPGHTR